MFTGAHAGAEISLKVYVLRCLQHIQSLTEQTDFQNAMAKLQAHVAGCKGVQDSRKTTVKNFLNSIYGKATNWAAWAFAYVRQLLQRSSRSESRFSSIKANGGVNLQYGFDEVHTHAIGNVRAARHAADGEALSASRRSAVSSSSRLDSLIKDVSTHITSFALKHVRKEYEASYSYGAGSLDGSTWRVSALQPSANARAYGAYRTTYDVKLVKGVHLVCDCGFQTRNLMPCRHIIALKGGEVAKEDFHFRWLAKFPTLDAGRCTTLSPHKFILYKCSFQLSAFVVVPRVVTYYFIHYLTYVIA